MNLDSSSLMSQITDLYEVRSLLGLLEQRETPERWLVS